MKIIRVLNLYAGIGGNRRLWKNVEVTALENNRKIAKVYKHFFPKDKVIVGDAHQYLLKYFKNFDFIWSSPPCPTHSRFRFMTTKMTDKQHKRPIMYADMKLYQEAILLKHYFNGKYCIENVISYYDPLIQPQKSGRHYFWANFYIGDTKRKSLGIKDTDMKKRYKRFGLDIANLDTGLSFNKGQIMRNCVEPELGLYIFNRSKNKCNGLSYFFKEK